MRCAHEPIKLFDKSAPGNESAVIHYFLNPYARGRLEWVICRKCGLTGYWGGYGLKRRVRWNYGSDDMLKNAEHHNRLMRGEAPPPR